MPPARDIAKDVYKCRACGLPKKGHTCTKCQVCGKADEADKMLLCGDEMGTKGCNLGWHIFCLRPKLASIPSGDWFCGS